MNDTSDGFKHAGTPWLHTRKMITALAIVLACLCVFCIMNESDSSDAASRSGTVGECEWSISDDGTVLEISGEGALANYTTAKSAPWYAYRSTITEVIVDDGVTSIGAFSFRGYKALDYVIIPDSVQTISKYAFDGTSLSHIEFGSGLTTIGYRALNGLSFHLPDGTKLSVTPANLTNCIYAGSDGDLSVTHDSGVIGDIEWRFFADNGLLSITGEGAMPDFAAASKTPWYAYRASIAEVDVSCGITSVGAFSFKGYTALNTVYIDDTVETLGKYAFDGTSISHIAFGNGLTSIKYCAVNGLSFYMPDGSKLSVTPANLAGREFKGTENNLTLCYAWGCFGELNWALDMDGGIFCIDGNAAMPALSNYTAPWNDLKVYIEKLSVDCTSVSAYAFRNCANLQEVTFSDNVTTVMKYAFQNDASLTHVEFGEYMASVSAVAFPYKFYGSASSNMALTDSSVAAYAWDLTAVGSTYKFLKSEDLHEHSDAVVENLVDSTCSKKGSYESVVYCSTCGKELSREKIAIPLKEHTPVVDEAVPATTTATGLTEGSHCAVCGKVLVKQKVTDIIKVPEFTTGYTKLDQAEIIDSIIAGNKGAGYGCTSSVGSTYVALPEGAECEALYQWEDTGDEEWTWHTDHSKCILYTDMFPYVYYYETEYTAVSTETIILDGYEITCDVYYGTDPTQEDYGLKHYGYRGYNIVTLNEDGSVKGIHYRFDNYQGILDDIDSDNWQEYVMPIVHPEWCDIEMSETMYSITGYNVGETTVSTAMYETTDNGEVIYSYSTAIDYLEIDGVRHEGSELLKFLETFEPTEDVMVGAKYGFTFNDCGNVYSLDMELVRSNDEDGKGVQDGNGEWDSFGDFLADWWNYLLMQDLMVDECPGFKYVDTDVTLGGTDEYIESTTGSPATKFEWSWYEGEGYVAYYEYDGKTVYAEMTDYADIPYEFESNDIRYTVTGITALGKDYNIVGSSMSLFSDVYIHLSNPVKIEYANIIYQTEDGEQVNKDLCEIGSSVFIPSTATMGDGSYRTVSVPEGCLIGESFTMPDCDIIVVVKKMVMSKIIYQTEDGTQIYTRSFEVGSDQAYIGYIFSMWDYNEQKYVQYKSVSAPEGYSISESWPYTYFTMPDCDITVIVKEMIMAKIIYVTDDGKQINELNYEAGTEVYIAYSAWYWTEDAQTSIEYRSVSTSDGSPISAINSQTYFSMPAYDITVTVEKVAKMNIIYQTEDGTVISNVPYTTSFKAGSDACIHSTFYIYNGDTNVKYNVVSVSGGYPVDQTFTMPNDNISVLVEVDTTPSYPNTTNSDATAMEMIAEGTVSPGFGYYTGSTGYLITAINDDGTYEVISQKDGDWANGTQSTRSSLGMIYADYSAWGTKYTTITEEHTTGTVSGYDCDIYTINGYRESNSRYIVYYDYNIVKYNQNTLSITGSVSYVDSYEEIEKFSDNGVFDVEEYVSVYGANKSANTVYTYVYVPNYSDYLTVE